MQNKDNFFDVIIIGGGASGFFCAINMARLNPKLKIAILEKNDKVLQKVKVSGGGRCNVTHHYENKIAMSEGYPRGKNFSKKNFYSFGNEETISWFKERGVSLKIEEDGRMFPTTDSSQTIIDCFLKEIDIYKIKLFLKQQVIKIENLENNYCLETKNGQQFNAQKICVAIGGQQKMEQFEWLKHFGHTIDPLLPSLFTFNLASKSITQLQGLSMPNVTVKLPFKKLESTGSMLITHWGFSGPAVLKLSAFAAEWLHQNNYNTTFIIKWIGNMDNSEIAATIMRFSEANKQALVYNRNCFEIPKRLWEWLCISIGILPTHKWMEMGTTWQNKIVNVLTNNSYDMNGKTTFKEEFVTCGGINLQEIDTNTMQSKLHNGLYFIGEVLNVDGITGGYNFQNAWSTGYIAAVGIATNATI
jgi:predicted Rossmann fold flavoprotein